jgi:hypothetical protein
LRRVAERHQRFSARQDDRIEKPLIPGHEFSPRYAKRFAPA